MNKNQLGGQGQIKIKKFRKRGKKMKSEVEEIKDESIFHGWLQFQADNQWWRAEDKGAGIFAIFKKDEDGRAYIHQGTVRLNGKPNCDRVYKAICEMEDE